MKLISMVDFVLEQSNANVESDLFYFLCSNYAQFLKQPLTLGMFVPCVDDKPFEVQVISRGGKILNQPDIDKYEQARERVLFEGFKVEGYEYGKYITVRKDDIILTWSYNRTYFFINEGRPIEVFVNSNLTLTQSALKQLGI